MLTDPVAHAAPLATGSTPPTAGVVTIGIVGAAKKRGGERHFETLLDAAAPGRVLLRHFTLGEDLARLWDAKLDGLIVAGAEPRAASMAEEPSWPDLAQLVDWAGAHTAGAIWSCFAAHAAVYRMDGIARQRLPQKLSGVFACASADPGSFAGLPARISVPHSRCNTLSEDALLDRGYQIISRAPGIGADAFMKVHGHSQFLFVQGHGEYGPRTLLNEYSRDISRFLAGTQVEYPDMPANYFMPHTEEAFLRLRDQALRTPKTAVFAGFGWHAIEFREHEWQDSARQLYAAWVDGIATRKALKI